MDAEKKRLALDALHILFEIVQNSLPAALLQLNGVHFFGFESFLNTCAGSGFGKGNLHLPSVGNGVFDAIWGFH